MVVFERFVDKYIGGVLVIIAAILDVFLKSLLFPIRVFTKSAKHLKQKQARQARNILIIKLWAVGDSVVSLLLLKALKARFSNSKITVLARKRNAAVFESCKYADKVVLFENFSEVIKLIRKFDVVIDLEPYLNLSALLSLYCGKTRVGLANQLRSILYTKKVVFTGKKHFVQVYLDMARCLGIEYDADELVSLNVPEKSMRRVDTLFRKNNILKTDVVYGICIGVAESVKSREWPAERFAELADKLLENQCDKVLFVGTSSEQEMVADVISRMKKKWITSNAVLNVAGKTSLKELFYLIKRCKVFISNDTGPMHIAAAQSCKTIGLFGPNTPVLWMPYGKKNRAVYKGFSVCKYSPCIRNIEGYMPKCRLGINKCMRAIQVSDVLRVVRELENL